MKKFTQNIQTINFLRVYRKIMKEADKRGVYDDQTLCERVLDGYNPAQFSHARGGYRNIPDKVIKQFVNYFTIDESLIFGKRIETDEETIARLTKEVEFLKSVINKLTTK